MTLKPTADDILSDQLRGVQAMIDRDEPTDLPKAGELWGDVHDRSKWVRVFEVLDCVVRWRHSDDTATSYYEYSNEQWDRMVRKWDLQRLSVIPTAELEALRNELKETRQYMEFQDAKHREMLESLGSWPMSEKGESQ